MATTPTKKTLTSKKPTATKATTTKKTTTKTTKPTTTSSTSSNDTTAQITALQSEVSALRQEIATMKETLTGDGGSDSARISRLEQKLNGLGSALRESILKVAHVDKTWKLRGFLDDLGLQKLSKGSAKHRFV